MRSIFCIQPTCLKLRSYSKQFNSAGDTWMNKIQPSFGTLSYTYKGRWPVNKLHTTWEVILIGVCAKPRREAGKVFRRWRWLSWHFKEAQTFQPEVREGGVSLVGATLSYKARKASQSCLVWLDHRFLGSRGEQDMQWGDRSLKY